MRIREIKEELLSASEGEQQFWMNLESTKRNYLSFVTRRHRGYRA